MVQESLFPISEIKVIELFSPTTSCAICGIETEIKWSIYWYEKPVDPDYPDACGMPVCEKCHDEYWRNVNV